MKRENYHFPRARRFGAFPNGLQKFWILFGKILNYPKMDITQCSVKYLICYVY